ncbi:MAG: hypothetical protein AABY15_03240 [Nanoarchaeota archaeon]
MKVLLEDIDDLFAHFEDFTHGKDGEDITRIRKRIAMSLKQFNFDEQILCIHSSREFVPGVFGGIYCNDCEEKIE